MKDVIVVGGGPGGTSVARACAEMGLDVVLYEKRQELGSPVRCGEGLSSSAVQFLGKIPDRYIAQSIDGAIIYAPNGKYIEIDYGKTAGYIVERRMYDRYLAEEAVRAGAKIRAKTMVKDVLKENGYIKGVKAEFCGKKFEVRSKIVVAADGIESKTARKAGLNTSINPVDVDSGFEYEMVGIELKDPHKIEIFFGNKIAPRGYCLTGDSEIITRQGLKPISKISVGEEVLTKDGWNRVKAKSVREYKGKIVNITPFMFNKEVRMTKDHLVRIWNKKDGFTWKKAEDLTKGVRGKHRNGDYLVFPLLKEPELKKLEVSKYYKEGIIQENYIYPKGRNQFGAEFSYKHKIPLKLKLTNNLLELMGFFVAEGNTNSNGIILSNTNKKLIDRFAKIGKETFGFKGNIWIQKRENEKHKNCYQLQFSSVILKKIFAELFGVGCKNKKLPIEFLGLNKDKKKSLIKGLFLGDGGIEKSSEKLDKLIYTTTSKHLIYDIWMLLSTIGIVGEIGKIKKKNAYRLRIRGKQLSKLSHIFGKLKHGNWDENRGFMVKDGKILMGIRKLEKSFYKGKVYDIQSGGSFVPFFVVHNCWIFPKGKDKANVGIGIGGIGNYGKTAKQFLDDWIEKKPEIKKGSITSVISGGIPVGNFLDNMVLNGFLVVGDAAHQVNPIHGGGMKEATIAGRIAGEVIYKAIQEGDLSQKRLSEYNKKWWKERGKKLKNVEKIRRVMEKLSDEDFNMLAENLNGDDLIGFTRGKKLTTLARVLMKKPKLMGLAKKLL